MNNKKYKTLVIDPPWSEVGGGKIKRGAQKHYPVMKTPAIVATIKQSKPFKHINEDAHLYLWVTNGFLQDGLMVMKALGFTYKTNWVWVKDRFGLGQYHRGQHELVLFGTRGKGYNVKTASKSIPSIVQAKRRAHSQKPKEFYDMVEKRSIGPYIDMFHRGKSRNMQWDVWGNEAIQKDDEVEEKMRPEWDEIWANFATQISRRSVDPKYKVGAVIVNDENTQVLSIGYNGDQKGGSNKRESIVTGESGFIHAEENALIKLDYNNPKYKKMYVTLSPCTMCAKKIINAGIDEVVYLERYEQSNGIDILIDAGITVRKF